MESTTLPTLLLGGDPADPDEAFASWEKALALPSVRGLDRRTHPALPRRRRRQLGGRDRRVDGEVTDAQQVLHPGPQRRRCPTPSTSHPSPQAGPNPSLQVVELDSMQELPLDTRDTEVMILPLAGGGTVDVRQPRRSTCRHGHRSSTARPTWSTSAPARATRCAARAGSRSAALAPSGRSPTAGWPPPTWPSSCAAPATAAARCTTSAPQAFSRPTR